MHLFGKPRFQWTSAVPRYLRQKKTFRLARRFSVRAFSLSVVSLILSNCFVSVLSIEEAFLLAWFGIDKKTTPHYPN
jgi:hypothetical protein